MKVPQALVFTATQNPIHLFFLPPTCSVCHLLAVKTPSQSKDLLGGAHRGPGQASDHRCIRGIWWHKTGLMWYCHQSALTRLARSRQTPTGQTLPASRAAAGRGTGTQTHTHTHTLRTHTYQILLNSHSETAQQRPRRLTMSFPSQSLGIKA